VSTYQLKTPVVFIIFKRPETTQKVFERIRQAKPPKLLVIADSPRAEQLGEAEKSSEARSIIDQVDWECEVLKNYSAINLGCATRVSSGLDWAFEQIEEAIILEDDCVPHPTFFRYCEELLERYRDDSRIGSITGQNVQFGKRRAEADCSYYYSIYSHCWGWATWKRAWQNYDLDVRLWPKFKKLRSLNTLFSDAQAVKSWNLILQNIYEHPLDITWDYQWLLTCWIQGYLTVVSDVNLVSNIGFDASATNYATQSFSPYNNMLTEPMIFPLQHPDLILRNQAADRFTQNTLYDYYSLRAKIRGKVYKFKHWLKRL
jgi:hypothetical protein